MISFLKELFSDKKYIKVALYVAITALLLYFVYVVTTNITSIIENIGYFITHLVAALAPVLIGLFLAYLVAPIARSVDNKLVSKLFINIEKIEGDDKKKRKIVKRRRVISVLLTFLIILAVIAVVIYAFAVLILGQLFFSSIQGIYDDVVNYINMYWDELNQIAQHLEGTGFAEKLQGSLNSALQWISEKTDPQAILDFVVSLGGGILNVFLGIVVCIYILIDREFFQALWNRIIHMSLGDERAIKTNATLGEVNHVISQFLRGQLLDGLIIAILSSVALNLIGLKFAVFVGCFAGIANVIPYFGPILGMIPAAIIAILTGGFTQAILAVVVLFVIQQIDGAVISPRVVGSTTGLHPIFVLGAVTFGGYYWGIVGMLLAVPAAAIIKLFISKKIKIDETE